MHPPIRGGKLGDVAIILPMSVIIIPLSMGVFFGLLLAYPYTLTFFSSNFGLKKRHHAAVQLYLDHFERLNPALMARLSQYFSSTYYRQKPPRMVTRAWPSKNEWQGWTAAAPGFSSKETPTLWSMSALLFSMLMPFGFRKKALYAFLQDQVESQISSLTEEDKANYRHAMHHACDHDLISLGARSFGHVVRGVQLLRRKRTGFTMPTDGRRVVPVKNCNLDWIIAEKGSLIVPMDWASYEALESLQGNRQVGGPTTVWKLVKSDQDLATALGEDWWGMIDLR